MEVGGLMNRSDNPGLRISSSISRFAIRASDSWRWRSPSHCRLTARGPTGPRQGDGEKPTVDIVQTVGCAERKRGNPETVVAESRQPSRDRPRRACSTRTRSNRPRKIELGASRFSWSASPTSSTPKSLLKSGQRKEFTNRETANATDQLRARTQSPRQGHAHRTTDEKRDQPAGSGRRRPRPAG